MRLLLLQSKIPIPNAAQERLGDLPPTDGLLTIVRLDDPGNWWT